MLRFWFLISPAWVCMVNLSHIVFTDNNFRIPYFFRQMQKKEAPYFDPIIISSPVIPFQQWFHSLIISFHNCWMHQWFYSTVISVPDYFFPQLLNASMILSNNDFIPRLLPSLNSSLLNNFPPVPLRGSPGGHTDFFFFLAI